MSEAVEENGEPISVLFLGPLYGWFCASCGETRMGHSSEEEAKSSASSHAIVKHSPAIGAPGSGQSSMTLHVEWDEGD